MGTDFDNAATPDNPRIVNVSVPDEVIEAGQRLLRMSSEERAQAMKEYEQRTHVNPEDMKVETVCASEKVIRAGQEAIERAAKLEN